MRSAGGLTRLAGRECGRPGGRGRVRPGELRGPGREGGSATGGYADRHAGPQAALAVPAENALLSGLRQEHPRLLLLPDDVARLQGVIAGDATARGYRDALLRSGERMLGEPVSQRVLIGPRLLTPAGPSWSG